MRFLALALWSCACVPPGEVGVVEDELKTRDPEPDRHALSVCWENTHAYNLIIREAVQLGWEREGAVNFTGWDNLCSQHSARVHLRWWDEARGHTEYPFLHSYFEVSFDRNADLEEQRSQALHEFGHVLGFEHEQDGGHQPLTPYDQYSVMNYFDEDRIDVLSGWDVEGMRFFYGRKPAKTLITSIAGRCMDVPGNSTVSGTALKEAVCDNFSSQLLDVYLNDDQIRRVANPGMCLAAESNRVVQRPCDSTSAAQKWKAFDKNPTTTVRPQLIGPGGYCLALGGTSEAGNYLVLRSCISTTSQYFFWDETSRSLRTEGGLCVDAGNPSQMWTWPCNESPPQKFRFDVLGRFMSDSYTCMRVENNAPFDGAKVVPAVCDGSETDLWRQDLGMQLRGVGGKCLKTQMATSSQPTWVQLDYCDASTTQRWFYASSKIKSLGGECLTAFANGQVDAQKCDSYGSYNGPQKWAFAENGEIHSLQYPGWCLDAAHGDPNAGTYIGIYPCNSTPAQRWSLSGRIRQNGLCLEGGWVTGDPLRLMACINAPKQLFDYQF